MRLSNTHVATEPPDFTRVQPHTSRQDMTRTTAIKPKQTTLLCTRRSSTMFRGTHCQEFQIIPYGKAAPPVTTTAPAAHSTPIYVTTTCTTSPHACTEAALGSAALSMRGNCTACKPHGKRARLAVEQLQGVATQSPRMAPRSLLDQPVRTWQVSGHMGPQAAGAHLSVSVNSASTTLSSPPFGPASAPPAPPGAASAPGAAPPLP